MKVLVVSVSTGGGHNAAGRAVFEELGARGVEAEFLDLFSLVGERLSQRVGDTYAFIVNRMPDVFRCMYRAGDAIRSDRRKSPVYWANRLCRDRLSAHLEEGRFDAVVTPHLFPAETLTSLRREGRLKVPTMAVATDYTCIPFWEDLEMDGIVIGHKSQLGEMVERGLDPKLLAPLGIPVSAKFAKAYDKAETRAKLGLGDAERIYLIMTGSMGFGNISAILTPLLSACGARDRVVVLGGRNEKLKSSLRAKYESERKLQVVDFTTEVERYMAACDVLFTKPGGLSTSEAATMGVPLIHTKPIPGVESRNAVFFSSLGMSIYEKNVPAMVRRAVELAGDEDAKREMIRRQHENINPNAAGDICDYIIRSAQE